MVYGEVPKGEKVMAEINAKTLAKFSFEFHPKLWAECSGVILKYYGSKKWSTLQFCSGATLPPENSGIYMFVVAPRCGDIYDHSYIFYIGKTKDLRRRYNDYLNEQAGKCENPREKVVRFLNYFKGYLFFHYTLVPEHELEMAENLLKDNMTPPANDHLNIRGRI